MIIGETQSYGIGLDNIYLIKVGANGNLVWTKTYGDTFLHDAFFFDSTNDGGFIIAGRGANSGDAAYLLRIDSIGNILWNKTYGKSYIDLAYAAHQTRDNGFILTGRTTNPITFHADILLIKTDSSGTMQWNNVIGGTGYKRGLSVEETNDGGYIIAGENNSEQKIYLIKTDSIGNSECYGGSAVFIEGNPATQVTVASSLVSAASFITLSPATSVSSGSILNTPCSNVSVYDQTENSNFVTVFPDPSTGIFTIKFIIPVNKGTIEIYNMTGNKVFEDIIYLTEKKVVSLNNISKGIYTVKVLTEANVFCKKIIIQ